MYASGHIVGDQGLYREDMLVPMMAAIGTPQLAAIMLDLLHVHCRATSVSIVTADRQPVLALRSAAAPGPAHRYRYASPRSITYMGPSEPSQTPTGLSFGQRPAAEMSILLSEAADHVPFDPLEPRIAVFLETLVLVAEVQARRAEAAPSRQLSCTEIELSLARTRADLTLREREVCARTVMGMTATGISLDLGISVTTVATYRRRAYTRLGICSAYELLGLMISAPRRPAPTAATRSMQRSRPESNWLDAA